MWFYQKYKEIHENSITEILTPEKLQLPLTSAVSIVSPVCIVAQHSSQHN